MQNYTHSVAYKQTELDPAAILSFSVPHSERLKIDPAHPSYQDANLIFDQSRFKYPYLPLYMGEYEVQNHQDIDRNVLRLMVRTNDRWASVHLPECLLPL
jgi:hypothetical protein